MTSVDKRLQFVGGAYFPPYLHAQTKPSEERVRAILARLGDEVPEVGNIDVDHFFSDRQHRKAIRDLCQKYWRDKEWEPDDLVRLAKFHAGKISKAAARFVEAVADTPSYVHGLILGRSSEQTNFSRTVSDVEAWILACGEIAQIVGRQGRPANDHIDRALGRLVSIWQSIAGKKLPKTIFAWKSSGSDALEFVEPGPRFVLQMLRAVDPSITFAEVRTAFKKRVWFADVQSPIAASKTLDHIAEKFATDPVTRRRRDLYLRLFEIEMQLQSLVNADQDEDELSALLSELQATMRELEQLPRPLALMSNTDTDANSPDLMD